MLTQRLAKLASGHVHYAWIVLAVMFTTMLAGVGVRAAPGVMIVPLQRAFGWDVSTISAAVSINIVLLGVTVLVNALAQLLLKTFAGPSVKPQH